VKPAGAVPIAGFYFLYFGCVGVTLPYLAAYLKTLDLSASQVGVLLALSPALALVAPSLWGHLADRSGRPDRVLRALGFGACVGFAPLLWARSYLAVAACTAAYALFNSSITAVIDGVALQRVHSKGGSFARLRLWGSLGFVCAATAFGQIAVATDRATVVASLALMTGYAAWAWTLDVRSAPRAAEVPFAGLRLLHQRDLLWMLIASALHWIACAPFHGMFAIHVQALHLPLWVVGSTAGLGVIAEVGVMYAYPKISERVSARFVLGIAFLGSAIRWLAMAAVTSATGLILLSLLHGLTFGAFYVAGIAFVSRRVPEGLRARGQALFASFTFGLGGLVGYLGAGIGYDLFGGRGLFATAAAVELLAIAFLVATRTSPNPGIEAVPC
jgi:PPP family 3-phenylpropionic acid transporter